MTLFYVNVFIVIPFKMLRMLAFAFNCLLKRAGLRLRLHGVVAKAFGVDLKVFFCC